MQTSPWLKAMAPAAASAAAFRSGASAKTMFGLLPPASSQTLHVRLAGIDHQLLGDLGRTGEHQGVDIHVQCQRLAYRVAIARQHVEHAFRNTGLDGQLGDADGGQRRLLGGLEDHRVAGGQGRTEFPAGHQQREVPRHDGGDHADRLAGHQAQLGMGSGGDFVIDLVDRLGAPAQAVGGAGDVDVQRVADRLAHVQGFQQGQLLGVLQQQIGEADHRLLALGRRQARPGAGIEGIAGDLDRLLGIGQVATGDLGQEAAIHRAQAVEGLAGGGVAVFAVDEGAAFDLQVFGAASQSARVRVVMTTCPLIGVLGAWETGALSDSARRARGPWCPPP